MLMKTDDWQAPPKYDISTALQMVVWVGNHFGYCHFASSGSSYGNWHRSQHQWYRYCFRQSTENVTLYDSGGTDIRSRHQHRQLKDGIYWQQILSWRSVVYNNFWFQRAEFFILYLPARNAHDFRVNFLPFLLLQPSILRSQTFLFLPTTSQNTEWVEVERSSLTLIVFGSLQCVQYRSKGN